MCEGYYDGPHDRPMVKGILAYPQRDQAKEISFLIDTGADTTCISGLAAVSAGLTPEDLPAEAPLEEKTVGGVAGEATAFHLDDPVLLAFREQSEAVAFDNLHVEVLDGIEIVPTLTESLLGRDVLNRFDLSFSHTSDAITLNRHMFGGGAHMNIPLDEDVMSTLDDL
jgi:predicted aspartyl protease